MIDERLYCYVVYKNPKDFPGEFVVRVHCIGHGTHIMQPTLFMQSKEYRPIEERLALMGLYRIARDHQDDPVVMETWV